MIVARRSIGFFFSFWVYLQKRKKKKIELTVGKDMPFALEKTRGSILLGKKKKIPLFCWSSKDQVSPKNKKKKTKGKKEKKKSKS